MTAEGDLEIERLTAPHDDWTQVLVESDGFESAPVPVAAFRESKPESDGVPAPVVVTLTRATQVSIRVVAVGSSYGPRLIRVMWTRRDEANLGNGTWANFVIADGRPEAAGRILGYGDYRARVEVSLGGATRTVESDFTIGIQTPPVHTVVVSVPPTELEQSPTADMRFRVTTADGEPISGALIRLSAYSSNDRKGRGGFLDIEWTTDATGSVSVSAFYGTYRYIVSARRFSSASGVVELARDRDVLVELQSADSTIVVQVAQKEQPISEQLVVRVFHRELGQSIWRIIDYSGMGPPYQPREIMVHHAGQYAVVVSSATQGDGISGLIEFGDGRTATADIAVRRGDDLEIRGFPARSEESVTAVVSYSGLRGELMAGTPTVAWKDDAWRLLGVPAESGTVALHWGSQQWMGQFGPRGARDRAVDPK